jgi:hypothetical protein
VRVRRPAFADSGVGCEPAQGLEPVGVRVGLDAELERIVAVVGIAFDGGVFERHFIRSTGPLIHGLGVGVAPMLDVVSPAGVREGMAAPARART